MNGDTLIKILFFTVVIGFLIMFISRYMIGVPISILRIMVRSFCFVILGIYSLLVFSLNKG